MRNAAGKVTFDLIKRDNLKPTEIKSNLNLVTSLDEVKITWTSSKPEVISNLGVVTRGTEDVEVILTAKLTHDDYESKEVKITVKVLKVESDPEPEVIEKQLSEILDVEFSVSPTFEKHGKQVKFSVEGINIPYSGYRAIHLTFMIGGLMTEMQLHTEASWQIKMEQEKIYAKWRNLDENKLSPQKKADFETDFIKSKELGKKLDGIHGDLEEFVNSNTSFSLITRQSSATANALNLDFSHEDPFQYSTSLLSNDTLNKSSVSLSNIYVYDTKSPLSKDSL